VTCLLAFKEKHLSYLSARKNCSEDIIVLHIGRKNIVFMYFTLVEFPWPSSSDLEEQYCNPSDCDAQWCITGKSHREDCRLLGCDALWLL
jgi:hypothetical protein